MNTLVLWACITVLFLYSCVQTVRKWWQGVRPRTVAEWVLAIGGGIAVIVGVDEVLTLWMHPAQIQPPSGWFDWLLGLILLFLVSSMLVSIALDIGRRIRQLGR